MNFGNGEDGFGAGPSAKSMPVAENCTVLSVSTPMTFDALPMTVLASSAEPDQASRAANPTTTRHFFNIISRPFVGLFLARILEGCSARANGRHRADGPRPFLPASPS